MKLSVTAAVLTTLVARATCQSLPQVDLGYEIHQAISYDVSHTYRPSYRLSHLVRRMSIRRTTLAISDMHNLQ